jgi:hypothetical protein
MTRVLMEHCHEFGLASGSTSAEDAARMLVVFFGNGTKTPQKLHEALRAWRKGAVAMPAKVF